MADLRLLFLRILTRRSPCITSSLVRRMYVHRSTIYSFLCFLRNFSAIDQFFRPSRNFSFYESILNEHVPSCSSSSTSSFLFIRLPLSLSSYSPYTRAELLIELKIRRRRWQQRDTTTVSNEMEFEVSPTPICSRQRAIRLADAREPGASVSTVPRTSFVLCRRLIEKFKGIGRILLWKSIRDT